jgi:hypothetical protein
MLREEIKNIKSDTGDLRKFGITVGIVLALLGGLLLWREKDYSIYFLIISFVLISLGIISPIILKPVQKAWMTLAVVIGWFMTRVILSILFYLVFTPIGLIGKIFKKDFLDLEFHDNKKSYWIERKEGPREKDSYEKQF